MDWIPVKKDVVILRKAFFAFFNYTWQKNLSINPLQLILSGLGVVSIFVNVLRYIIGKENKRDLLTAVIIGCVMGAILPIGYLINKQKMIKWLEKYEKGLPDSYSFAYDADGIYYEVPKFNMHMKWDFFSYYQINKKAIYIYDQSSHLKEIVLEQLIGEAHFISILQIIQSKLPNRKN